MKILILILMGLSFNAYSQNCVYSLNMVNATVEILDSSQVIQQPFTLSRSNANAPVCQNYRVFFSKGMANNYQRRAFSVAGNSLTYNLHRTVNQSGILKEKNDAIAANEYLEGVTPNKDTTYTNNFFISVPGKTGNSIPAGYYSDAIQASLYTLDNGSLIFETNDNLTVLFYVTQVVQVSIIDEGGTFDAGSTSKVLDFGFLSQNAEKGADLRVLSNGSYQLKISSQNNGQLKLSAGDLIAYSLRVNGATVNLASSSGTPVQIGTGSATSNAGDLFNLKVKILEATTTKSAGMYQDILTITAIAN